VVAALNKAPYPLPLLFTLLAVPSAPSAHRLDEYLQATLVAVEPDGVRLQLNLEPGVTVAEQVLKYIDRDSNHEISASEATGYTETLQHDLTLRIDGQAVLLSLTGSTFPSPTELRSGSGIMQLEFSAKFRALAAGAHRLVFENRHFGAVSVYLFNAVRPVSNAIEITQQQRNRNQSTGEIEFTLRP
jgi:hypothetical protein